MKILLTLMLAVSCCGIRAQDLAVVNAKIYTSPDSPPVDKASVLIRAGKITAIGRHLTMPPSVKTLPCDGCIVLAGFWNTHVHFMEPKWANAAHAPAEQLTRQLQEMLTHSGFTTVVDLGSDPDPRWLCAAALRAAKLRVHISTLREFRSIPKMQYRSI